MSARVALTPFLAEAFPMRIERIEKSAGLIDRLTVCSKLAIFDGLFTISQTFLLCYWANFHFL